MVAPLGILPSLCGVETASFALQPRSKAIRIGIRDHDLVCSLIQVYRNQGRHRRIEGAAVYIKDRGWAVVDVDIKRAQAGGGVVNFELIGAGLCNRDGGKRNGVLVAGAVGPDVGPTRTEAATAEPGRATELCRFRFVRCEIGSSGTSVARDDDTIKVRSVRCGIAERDRIVTREELNRYGGGLRQVKAASAHVQRRRVGSVHVIHQRPWSLCRRVNFHAIGSSCAYEYIERHVVAGGRSSEKDHLCATRTGGARRSKRASADHCGLCFIGLAGGRRNRAQRSDLQET